MHGQRFLFISFRFILLGFIRIGGLQGLPQLLHPIAFNLVLQEPDGHPLETSFVIIILQARRSNQSILKEISPGCSLQGLMLKLKLQYFGHFM